MYAKGWQGSRAACLGMIAVMGVRRDYDGVLYVSSSPNPDPKLEPAVYVCVVTA